MEKYTFLSNYCAKKYNHFHSIGQAFPYLIVKYNLHLLRPCVSVTGMVTV